MYDVDALFHIAFTGLNSFKGFSARTIEEKRARYTCVACVKNSLAPLLGWRLTGLWWDCAGRDDVEKEMDEMNRLREQQRARSRDESMVDESYGDEGDATA
jgi:hypothetical protein